MANKIKNLGVFLGLSLILCACGGGNSSQISSSPNSSSQPSSASVSSAPSSKPSSAAPSSSEPSSSAQSSSKPSSAAPSSSKPSSNSSVPVPSSQSSAQPSSSGGDVTPFQYESKLLKHAEGQTVNYIFEAECTDLRGKSGPGYSGNGTEKDLARENEECAFITYLYKEGCSVNFLVVSDRDVTNAKLYLRCGAEFIHLNISPENYTIRVDGVTDEDLLPYTQDGAYGRWDNYFLKVLDVEDTGGYYIENWTCGNIDINCLGISNASKFNEYEITANLRLKRGVNSISFITGEAPVTGIGTIVDQAPVIDYIKITTDAQLGTYESHSNGVGDVGVRIA